MKVTTFALTLVTAVLLTAPVRSQNKKETEWTGDGSDNAWTTRANWSRGSTHAGILAKIYKEGATVVLEGGNVRCRGIELGEGATLMIKGGSLQASYAGIIILGGTLNVAGGEVITGVPGKYPRRIMLRTPGSEFHFGSPTAENAPTARILEQLAAGAGPKHGGALHFFGYGSIAVGQDMTAGRWGEADMTVEGGNLTIHVAGNLFCGYGSKWCTITYVIDESGASTITVDKDILLGHGKQAYNRAKFQVRFAEGFVPDPGTEYRILTSTGGTFANYPAFGNVANGDILDVDGVKLKAVYTDSSFTLVVQ